MWDTAAASVEGLDAWDQAEVSYLVDELGEDEEV